jgi:hypothetical protein
MQVIQLIIFFIKQQKGHNHYFRLQIYQFRMPRFRNFMKSPDFKFIFAA